MNDRFQQLRLIEALLFASQGPLTRNDLARHLPDDADLDGLIEELKGLYANRGVTLVQVGERWAFRTAADLAPLMKLETTVKRKLSRAAVETLAVIAYHQPVTRAEIEEIRGVSLSRGTLDVLLEAGWIKPRGRRRVPGRPITWGTSPAFLDQFGLETIDALPGRDELKAAGLLDTRPAMAVMAARGELDEEEDDEGEDGGEGDEPLAADEALAEDFGVADEIRDEADDEAAAEEDAAEPAEDGEPEPEPEPEQEAEVEPEPEAEPAPAEEPAAEDQLEVRQGGG